MPPQPRRSSRPKKKKETQSPADVSTTNTTNNAIFNPKTLSGSIEDIYAAASKPLPAPQTSLTQGMVPPPIVIGEESAWFDESFEPWWTINNIIHTSEVPPSEADLQAQLIMAKWKVELLQERLEQEQRLVESLKGSLDMMQMGLGSWIGTGYDELGFERWDGGERGLE